MSLKGKLAVFASHARRTSTTYVQVLGATTIALVLGIPYAATRGMLPLDGSAWATEDGRTRVVAAALAAGLAMTAVAIALVATGLTFRPHQTRRLLWGLWSLAAAVYALGLACYPVWLNGAMAASERELSNELDPGRVAPFVWFRAWFGYPNGLLTFGMMVITAFTPLIAVRLIGELIRRRWSWHLASEAALPLTWICFHQQMLFAFAWSLD